MTFANFAELFRCATGNPEPFPYQVRYAEAEKPFDLVHAPTGAGKTATAVLGWLWRYKFTQKPTPRRLVYCLPMRVLVEQTRDAVEKWLRNLELNDEIAVHVLMGGEERTDWDLDPERPAVLLGTQDMLLSRALNRGYGLNRYRWPTNFGLLNSDCLWVLDEIQLMGTGLATSTQLQAFRDALGTLSQARTVWMSATLLRSWLESIDFRARVPGLRTLALDSSDYTADGLRERWEGLKPLASAGVSAEDTKGVAEFVKENHKPGSLTLVIVNTVDRCRALFEALRTLYAPVHHGKKHKQPDAPSPSPELKLIHSRFRPMERELWRDWLTETNLPNEGRIIVSTQVVEAGVDISARTLITELAPWPSLVQRVGRCNRRGEFTDARVFWLDVPTKDEKKALPYSADELNAARTRLEATPDVGLRALTEFFDGLSETERADLFPFDPAHVVRRKDFIDLFDTTPDLAGNDIDVSRFIRDGDDLDVQVFWRAEPPPDDELSAREARQLAPVRRELCPVPVGAFRKFLEDAKKGALKKPAFRWDALDGKWTAAEADAVFPGQVYWVVAGAGGYSRELGWSPNSGALDADVCLTREPEPEAPQESQAKDDDAASESRAWQTIAEHTNEVVAELEQIVKALGFELPRDALAVAARWHDWGKAHEVFQNKIADEATGAKVRPDAFRGSRLVAKAAEGFWRHAGRKHFRHELASALGVLTLLNADNAPPDWAALADDAQRNLALYLIAAHHGKVRQSIRSMPDERAPREGKLFARGVWEGDPLPATDLGGGASAPLVGALALTPMLLGRTNDRPSWGERVLSLRDDTTIGPLRLAFLEALIRAADMRASRAADERAAKGEVQS